MTDLSTIHFNARVYGSDGLLVGFVDAVVDGTHIRLRTSSCRYGGHEFVPSDWVAAIADGEVRLDRSEADARAGLRDGGIGGGG